MPASSDKENESSSKKNVSPARNPAGTSSEWTMENSSLWWLKHDFFQHPGTVLLVTSLPFCMGAYYGFLKPGHNIEEWVGDTPTKSLSSTRSINSTEGTSLAARRAMEREAEIMAARQLGFHVASRALGLATLGTIGTFGVLGAVGFYAFGCESIEETMWRTRRWASSRTQSFEDWMGLQNRESKTHPEVVATRNMTDEEEIQYVYDRLMKEAEKDYPRK